MIYNNDYEVWVDIKGGEGLYQISNQGRLKSMAKVWICGRKSIRKKPETIMKWAKDDNGYSITSININGKRKMISLHRMLGIHFIPNPENKPEVNHKNGIKTDNRLSNLEWVTSSENRQHAYDNNLKGVYIGTNHWNSKSIMVVDLKSVSTISFPSIAKCSKEFNVNERTIRDNLKGRKKSWKYRYEYL